MRRNLRLLLIGVSCFFGPLCLFYGVFRNETLAVEDARSVTALETLEYQDVPPAFGHWPASLIADAWSMRLTNDMLDNLNVELPPLLPNFKSPCWLETLPEGYQYPGEEFTDCLFVKGIRNTQRDTRVVGTEQVQQLMNERQRTGHPYRVRCFPYFFLLGVTKCGTTDVFHAIYTYVKGFAAPQVKEPHYWDSRYNMIKLKQCAQFANETFANYMNNFDYAAAEIASTATVQDNGELYFPGITGDFTPTTLNRIKGWYTRPGNVDQTEPTIITPHYIKHMFPKTKFIVMIRDPVERYYSNYKMTIRLLNRENMKQRNDSFLNSVQRTLRIFQQCVAAKTLRACVYTGYGVTTYLTRGLYHVYIQDWLKIFPREQFLFISNEDYRLNRREIIRDIVSFLDADPLTVHDESQLRHEQAIILREFEEAKTLPLEASDLEAKELLRKFYKEHNHALIELLGDVRFDWGY